MVTTNVSKIVIIGASASLDRLVAQHYLSLGWEVHLIAETSPAMPPVVYHHWDGYEVKGWASIFEESRIVLNLRKSPLSKAFGAYFKKYASRADETLSQSIAREINCCRHAPKAWLQLFSTAIYSFTRTVPQDESTGVKGVGIKAAYCDHVEKEFFDLPTSKTLKYGLRTDEIIGEGLEHGYIKRDISKIRNQAFTISELTTSWIHIGDFRKALSFIVTQKLPEGIYNLCAPTPINSKKRADHLKDRFKAYVSRVSVKSLVRLTKIRKVKVRFPVHCSWAYPGKLLLAGFRFEYPQVT